eukprot:scaffold454686_cov21-Prasinocladus_malaysianus.AAC.1
MKHYGIVREYYCIFWGTSVHCIRIGAFERVLRTSEWHVGHGTAFMGWCMSRPFRGYPHVLGVLDGPSSTGMPDMESKIPCLGGHSTES